MLCKLGCQLPVPMVNCPKDYVEQSNINLNALPNNKILGLSKLKAFADDKLNANEKLKFGLGSVENIVRKGENAGDQHFLLFPQRFPKPPVSGSLKVRIVW